MLSSEFDAAAYDLVMGFGSVILHIQLKIALVDGSMSTFKIGLNLINKPSGCVICIVVDDYLNFQSFLWFGGDPGQALLDFSSLPIARHTKANEQGMKTMRPNMRDLKRKAFEQINALDVILLRLFGPINADVGLNNEKISEELE